MKKNILIGICGIGFGHSLRQSPVIRAFLSKGHNVAVFSFGESLEYIKNNFPAVKVYEVFVPWICGGANGLDYYQTANKMHLMSSDEYAKNWLAMDSCLKFFGEHIDLVVSDYEPTSAQLAYSRDIKLITLDQQSKYLGYSFNSINGYTYLEEKARLNLFFPAAHKRFACSFFKVNGVKSLDKTVSIIPPFIRPEVQNINKTKATDRKVIVYLSSYSNFVQPIEKVCEILGRFKDIKFSIFSGNKSIYEYENNLPNISIYKFDSAHFVKELTFAKAAITTGGHNFLSEAMYLNMPVYVIPLGNYEQHMNGKVINDNEFGVCFHKIEYNKLKYFLSKIDHFKNNILKDNKVLLRKIPEKQFNELVDSILR